VNLLFRLIKILSFAIGHRRVELLAATRVRLRVWPNDLDLNFHVNNGRYLSLADLGRIDYFIRSGLFEVARRERAFPIVGDAIAKFRRDLKVFEVFDIETRMLGWDHKWGFMEHRFIKDGRVIGVVAIRGVFRGKDGPVDPNVFLAGLAHHHPSPPLPQWIQEWNQGCESLSTLLRAEERSQQAGP
jgi:acyl-CoA thioesterase FadM